MSDLEKPDLIEKLDTLKLTFKQESFVEFVVSGMTGADAYRSAYDADGMSDNAIYREASLLLSSPKISQRVAELKEKLAQKAIWTREMSVKALVDALEEGRAAEKISAVKELNVMHGYNAPQKLIVDGRLERIERIIVNSTNQDAGGI